MNQEEIVSLIMDKARSQPKTYKGLENTILLCGLVMTIVSYDLDKSISKQTSEETK